MTDPGEYLEPTLPSGLAVRDLPVVDVRDARVAALAEVVTGDPHEFPVPVEPWPVLGNRVLDPGTGVGGGVAEGMFRSWWQGGQLWATNEAIGGRYVIGLATPPEDLESWLLAGSEPEQVLLWHLNYHPDGGQLFASVDGKPFLVPAVPAGPDPDLSKAVAIRSDGSVGICLRPGVWHDGVYPESGDGEFLTRQGAVHARVSASLATEFGCLLRVPLLRAG